VFTTETSSLLARIARSRSGNVELILFTSLVPDVNPRDCLVNILALRFIEGKTDATVKPR